LVGQRVPLDLVDLVRQVCEHQPDGRCVLNADGPAVGEYDPGNHAGAGKPGGKRYK
jgi:hypothetical protein